MKKTLLLAGLAVIVTGLAVAATTMAYQGNYTQKGPNFNPDQEAQVEAAMKNNDYDAWSKLMADRGRVTQVVNKDNFSKFAQAWKLGQEGKTADADAIRTELGLRTSDGQRTGHCGGGCKMGGQGSDGQGGRGMGFVDKDGDGVCDNHQK